MKRSTLIDPRDLQSASMRRVETHRKPQETAWGFIFRFTVSRLFCSAAHRVCVRVTILQMSEEHKAYQAPPAIPTPKCLLIFAEGLARSPSILELVFFFGMIFIGVFQHVL